MAVTFYLGAWGGTYTDTPTYTYAHASPDVPSSRTISARGNIESGGAGAPWYGRNVFDCSLDWHSGLQDLSLTSAQAAATTGRLLIECEPFTNESGERLLKLYAATSSNGKVEIYRQNNDGTDILRINAVWSAGDAQCDIAGFPTNPFCVEVIYDTNNATANQRVRARTWDMGGTAGSFNNATATSGNAGTMDQPVELTVADYENGLVSTRVGRVILANSTSDDLSTYGLTSASIAPKAAAYYRMMRNR